MSDWPGTPQRGQFSDNGKVPWIGTYQDALEHEVDLLRTCIRRLVAMDLHTTTDQDRPWMKGSQCDEAFERAMGRV